MVRWMMVAMVLASACSGMAEGAPWSVIVQGKATEAEKLAAVDLQRYFAQVTGVCPETLSPTEWKQKPQPAVVIGFPGSNSLIASLVSREQIDELHDDGFVVAGRRIGNEDVIVAAGRTPSGAVNAIYGLLRELGYGFYLGSEAIPDELRASITTETIARSPAFKIRGVLPWYNFFNSPTTWNPPDHRAFVDQLVRSGANFVGFHTYDKEPFGAFEVDGETSMGERLFNTSRETWGTRAVPTKDFAADTDKLYSQEYFGADTTLSTRPDKEVIREEKRILRDALDYAHRRGLKTCLGFEISHDPTDPAERDSFSRRLVNLLKTYPMLDYVWLWQPETQGVQGFRAEYNVHILPGKPAPNSGLPALAEKRREVFSRIVKRTAGERPFLQENEAGELARAMEGARLEEYAHIAHNLLKKHRPQARLVISGWGGDERLLSAEYLDGLDKLLPKDVIFASLDHIVPRERIDRAFHDLPPERERWPIPWLENDGDQWQPQPFVHVYEKLLRDAHKSRSQGILGIHWRTREVEENFGYMMSYAWDTDLTAEDYFHDLAARCYPREIASEMANVHVQLDQLGYRWVGGGGQTECAEFTCSPGSEEKATSVSQLRKKCLSLLPRSGKSKPRVQWLIDSMSWVLAYREAEVDALAASALLDQAQKETTAAAELAGKACAILEKGKLEQALQAFARRLTTRGEYGELATANCKAVPHWRGLIAKAEALGGDCNTSAPAALWEPGIMVPQLLTSVASGADLDLMPIVLGGKPAFAHFRKLDENTWETLPLKTRRGWVAEVNIPAKSVHHPGLMLGLSFSSDPTHEMNYGPVAITVLPVTR